MHLSNSTKNQADVRLTLAELLIVNNALNEVCHGIDLPDFDTRMGTSLENAKALLKQVGAAIAQVESAESEG